MEVHSPRRTFSQLAPPAHSPSHRQGTQDKVLASQGTFPCHACSSWEGGSCSHPQNTILTQTEWFRGRVTPFKSKELPGLLSPAPGRFQLSIPLFPIPLAPAPSLETHTAPSPHPSHRHTAWGTCLYKSKVYCHF